SFGQYHTQGPTFAAFPLTHYGSGHSRFKQGKALVYPRISVRLSPIHPPSAVRYSGSLYLQLQGLPIPETVPTCTLPDLYNVRRSAEYVLILQALNPGKTEYFDKRDKLL